MNIYRELACEYCGAVSEAGIAGRAHRWRINRRNFIKCYTLFAELLHDGRKIYFALPQVSTGESARLLLFARLHSVFHVRSEYSKFLQQSTEQRNFVLILDEIEAYFHPTWQREIVYDLINFLEWESNTFDAFDNIQIILSSNAPFFLSDLPKDSLICLDEEAAGREQSYSSFGQNIHTILKNSFLHKDSLMGAFAQKKIETAFALLQREDTKLDIKQLKEVQYIVEELEEPIIKHALEKLLMDRMRENEAEEKIQELAEYKRQISELQKKVEKLQRDIFDD